jgi:hypothetical protein
MKMTIEIPEEYINYLGKRVMDEYQYRGFTIGEWADKIMNNAPTADVEPAKHGRWIHHAGMNSKCSCCGRYFPVAEFEQRSFDVNFCIHCGARMDGD